MAPRRAHREERAEGPHHGVWCLRGGEGFHDPTVERDRMGPRLNVPIACPGRPTHERREESSLSPPSGGSTHDSRGRQYETRQRPFAFDHWVWTVKPFIWPC
jgi:hypothetical protein